MRYCVGNTVTNARTISADTEMIVAWKSATGAKKGALLAQIFRLKHPLIRQLTAKAARAEKTAESMEDLLQAGYIGFQRALQGFKPELGWAISTYAFCWIRKEVQRVAQAGRVVSLPRIRLTNEQRATCMVALKDNPDVVPESIGVKRNQLEQVRHSMGVRFVSDDTPRGAALIERRLREDVGVQAGMDFIDAARRRRRMNGVIARVRMGKTAEEIGITAEAYALALEVIQDDATPPQPIEDDMTTDNETHETPATAPRKKPGPKPGTTRAKAVARPQVPKKANARERLAARLAEVDAERALLEVLLAAPEDAVARVVAAFAA